MYQIKLRMLCQAGRQRLNALPFVFTLANACCGLMSVLCALDDQYYASAVFIFVALFLDALDGRIARALGSATSLGMELDSLCDAVSFCLAPAVLFYSAYLYEQGLLGLLVTGLYLCCGLFRLARFNGAHSCATPFFVGLPTPAAALLIAMITMYDPWLMAGRMHAVVDSPYVFMMLAIMSAFLMISSVRFPSFKQRSFDRLSCFVAACVLVAGILAVIHAYPLVLSVVVAYIFGGIIAYLVMD